MSEMERFLLYHEMWEQGIMPMDLDDHDATRRLAGLPPDEARVLKRRFRKLWRKLARTRPHRTLYGLGVQDPGRWKKGHRKVLVFYYCWERMTEKKAELGCKTGGTSIQ